MTRENKNKDINDFTDSTSKEARWWDWLSRILPLVAICTIAVFHFFKLHDIRDVILDVAVIVFFTICFVWWYWAIRKIVASAKYLKSSNDKFASLLADFKKLRKEVKDIDSNR